MPAWRRGPSLLGDSKVDEPGMALMISDAMTVRLHRRRISVVVVVLVDLIERLVVKVASTGVAGSGDLPARRQICQKGSALELGDTPPLPCWSQLEPT